MKKYVRLPQEEVTWRCCNGGGSKAALGMKTYVVVPLLEVI
jgi:hypothetical protein